MVVEDPAPAMAKQGLSGGALDDPDAEESERSDAIARGRVGRFFRVREPITPDPEDWRGVELSPAATRDTLLLPHPLGRRTGESCLSKLRRVVVTV